MPIEIKEKDDWGEKLRKENLTTIVDPMMLRCGELFLKGEQGVNDPKEIWSLLSTNLYTTGMFFDILILNEKLPIFNYEHTFDGGLSFDPIISSRINNFGDIFYDVNVGFNAYAEVKSGALTKLREIIQGDRKVQPSLMDEILSELSIAEYQWAPSLEDLEGHLGSEKEKRLAAFLLGGLIFGGYAQVLESDHYLQPNRSRLFLATSIGAESADRKRKLEDELFAKLKEFANTSCEDIPWLPTFFPYLLSKASTLPEILSEVAELRKSDLVAEYRVWLQDLLQDWQKNGHINLEKRKDVEKIAQNIQREIGRIPKEAPKFSIKVTATDIKPSIEAAPTLKSLWGWFIDTLPGNRYRKFLSRVIIEDYNFPNLKQRAKTVWSAKQ